MDVIRLTRLEDAHLLPDIERSAAAVFRSTEDLAWIADGDVQSIERHYEFIAAGCSWVAVDEEDRPIGFLVAEPNPDALHVLEVSIDGSRQGQGLGRALIGKTIEWAKEHGFAAVTLTTFRDVPWNEPFYRRLGFVTLAPEALTSRLKSILEQESEHGLPIDRRCAMALTIYAVQHARRTGMPA